LISIPDGKAGKVKGAGRNATARLSTIFRQSWNMCLNASDL